jgi:hypothetical protein
MRVKLGAGFENHVFHPDLRGQPVFAMAEPGETYEFIFRHEGQAVYAKICLQRPNLLVIIYSSHRPLKGDTL